MAQTLDRLTSDLTAAMKARDAHRTGVLRQAIGAVRAEEKAGPVQRELTEDDVLKVLAREVKKRRESADIYTDAGAPERAQAETAEADLIETYLPARLSDEELEALVRDVVAATGATSMRDMGAVMKEATARAGTSADGKKLSALVRAALAG
ncbi:GatB/YqeY domain-containing protein [Cellulomonas massiliensis]|uniref:GatB/YqeY domain-containing protein n=1 Tax=Cellulomonas massiliensis TaxID=1465811 RepID=UPI0002E784FF|nr:GatB/YqeY domain-containing protein [Cellulomonas massiliensis]